MAQTTLAEIAGTLRASARRRADGPDSDRDLLARYVGSRDESAFRALVNRHGKTVLTACRQVLTDPADIDDAFQAAFLVLLKKAKTVDAGTPLGGWLFAVAHRVAVRCRTDRYRRRVREAEAARRKPTAETTDLSWREAAAVLHAEVNALPDRYRLPLLLCCVQGLSRDEAAEQLGTTVGAVRGQLERGRSLLERRLTKRGVVLSAGLLAVLLEDSRAAGIPSADLIDSAVRAAGGTTSSAAAALARGAFPMTATLKRTFLPAVLALGLVGAGIGMGSGAPADDKPKPAMEKPKAEAKKDMPEAPAPKTVAGTVVGPDGEPVAGASVSITFGSHDERATVVKVGTTAADGKFRGALPKDVPVYFRVVATKPGFGAAWEEPKYPAPTLAAADNLTLKLTKDEPIRGRVVDTEGKPVAGVSIGVLDVIEPTNGDLDKLLKEAADGGFGTSGQWEKVLWLPKEIASAKTDKAGTFEMAGLGADRIVGLTVSGKGIARMSGLIVTRAGVDVGPLNTQPRGSMRTQKGRHHVFYTPGPTFVVEPGYAVEGVVTEKSTGKPVTGCNVQVNTGPWDRLHAVTDVAGAYRFDGLTKGMAHHISFTPPDGTPLFPTWRDVREPTGFTAAKHDAALAKGAVFAGTVIDRETKRPVAASFQIIPAADNDFAKKPEYETASRDMVWKGGGGSFRIVTLPGKSKVNISVVPTGTLHGEPFHPYRAGQTLEIDLPETGVKDHTVEIDRGKTATATAVDGAGVPVPGPVVSGITITNQDGVEQTRVFKLAAAESGFAVYGLGENEKRRVVAVSPKKRLAGSLLVSAGADEKLALVPLQPLRGSFTDAEGNPLTGLSLTIEYDGYGFSRLFREHAPKWVMTATTDKDGKFEIPDVVPGLPFTFAAHKGKTQYRGTPRLGTKTVVAGKPLDLGTRKLEEIVD